MAEKLINSKLEKPMVRCAGKYETEEERYFETARINKSKNLGRSRMVFKGNLGENEIKNFVNLTPSRPVSAYKFREVDKSRWMEDKNFFLSWISFHDFFNHLWAFILFIQQTNYFYINSFRSAVLVIQKSLAITKI